MAVKKLPRTLQYALVCPTRTGISHTQPDWRSRLKHEEQMNQAVQTPTETMMLVATLARLEEATHMVSCNEFSGSVFVKKRDFFVSQGGDEEPWGRHWQPVTADSIEHARQLGCKMFVHARPYERQAKP